MTDPLLTLYAATRPSPERVRELLRGLILDACARGFFDVARAGENELALSQEVDLSVPIRCNSLSQEGLRPDFSGEVARKPAAREGGETRERRQA